jgi:hypothetical protein
LISCDPVEARTILRRPYLPSGLESSGDPVRMGPSILIGGTAVRRATRSALRVGRRDLPPRSPRRPSPKAARLLNTFAHAYRPAEDDYNDMTSNTPVPQPVIRQVPRE